MLESLLDNWLKFLIPIFSPLVFISGVLLLLANKHERILFTPRRRLYRQLIKIVILAIIGTLLGFILINITAVLLNKDSLILSFSDIPKLVIIYLIAMPITLSLVEKNHSTYHWVYLKKYGYSPLLIHKVTFDNKLLLSSLRSTQDKFEQGFIILEETTILKNEKIHYIGPKKRNPFYVNRPKIEDLIEAIEKNQPTQE